MEAQVTNRKSGGVTVIDIAGRLGMSRSSGAVREAVRLALAEGDKKVLLNLTHVTHMDSSGIAELVSGYTMAVANQASLKLTGLNSRLASILEITGLGRILDIHADERSAILSFG